MSHLSLVIGTDVSMFTFEYNIVCLFHVFKKKFFVFTCDELIIPVKEG